MRGYSVPILILLVAFMVCIPILAEQTAEEKPAEAAEEAAKYVGDKKCKPCHGEIFKAWEETPHAKTFMPMVDSAGIDENCVPCHTVGYGKPGGFVDTTTTPHLKNVQCESCHGPGSKYMKLPIMKDREKALANGMIPPDEAVCKGCHTEEQSPEFDMETALKTGTHYSEAEEEKEEKKEE